MNKVKDMFSLNKKFIFTFVTLLILYEILNISEATNSGIYDAMDYIIDIPKYIESYLYYYYHISTDYLVYVLVVFFLILFSLFDDFIYELIFIPISLIIHYVLLGFVMRIFTRSGGYLYFISLLPIIFELIPYGIRSTINEMAYFALRFSWFFILASLLVSPFSKGNPTVLFSIFFITLFGVQVHKNIIYYKKAYD